jgi:putative ABC transport system permease protein
VNLLRLSLSYLRRRPLVAALNALLLALGVATIVLLLLFSTQLQRSLARDARGIDLVVGAKGSPLQLILSSIYHIDAPTGNVPLREVLPVIRSPFVAQAIPLGLGDSYRGCPVVGTTPDYLRHYSATVADGRLWAAPFEVVVGSEVARRTGLRVGASFTSSHGLSEAAPDHAATPMRVVGVLAPTGGVVDRLVVTGLPTIWGVHEGEGHRDGDPGPGGRMVPLQPAPPEGLTDEAAARLDLEAAARAGRNVTAVLVRYRSPLAVALFPRQVNAVASLTSAV